MMAATLILAPIFPEKYLLETLGLVYLPALTRNLPWAKA